MTPEINNQQIQNESIPPTNTNPQQLIKELAEVLKLQAAPLLLNTLALYWPIVAAIALSSLSSIGNSLWQGYKTLELILYLLFTFIFVFYSIPRIGLDRIQKRLWVRRYLTKREVMSPDESRTFIQTNKRRILAYKRYIFKKIYLVPVAALVTLIAIMGALAILDALSLYNGAGPLGIVAIVSLLGTILLAFTLPLYWLHTRTILMFAWEQFIDAIDSGKNISNEQLLDDARRLVKVLGIKGRAKFMTYDFTASSIAGIPAAAITQATQHVPKPIERTVNAYAMLYSFNAYQLENLAITYCFYMESKAKQKS